MTTSEIQVLFIDTVTAHGGTVRDTYDDGERLFSRSILPSSAEVRPNDRLQGGVALKAVGGSVWVHPYVFRQVCKNGAIMAEALESRHLEAVVSRPRREAQAAVREAVEECCGPEVFSVSAGRMRDAAVARAGAEITMMVSLLSHLPRDTGHPATRRILDRFFREGDKTCFGLLNAVTAEARETSNPDLRWRLEELGGGIATRSLPAPVLDWPAALDLPWMERGLAHAR